MPPPSIPLSKLTNAVSSATILSNPLIFRVTTLLNVDIFEHLLADHPNCPLVEWVCHGFWEGLWPGANTSAIVVPKTIDYSNHPLDEAAAKFVWTQRNKEITAGRYSNSFSKHLLPGMLCSPIHAIPKPYTTKLRLVNNHTISEFLPNSFINKDLAHICMDNLHDLGHNILRFWREHPDKPILLFKSNVPKAFCLVPHHPL